MMWTVALDGGPRRVNHAAVCINDKIYSFGGYCSGEPMDANEPIDVHELNTYTNRWRLLKPSVPEDPNFKPDEMDIHTNSSDKNPPFPYQRYGHTVCTYEGKAYLWGGRNDEFGASYTLHEFDPVTCQWRYIPVSGNVPPARDGHSAIVVGHKMYLFGGFEEDQQRFSQETYAFDFLTNRWTELATTGSPPVWRDFHTAVEIDNKMYVFGGRSDQMGQYHSTRDLYCDRLKVLDLKTLDWTDPVVNGTKPCGRRSHSAWAFNGKMYLFGGFLGTMNKHFNDLYSYDPATSTWRRHDPVTLVGRTPSARRRQCTVLVNNKIYLFGGTTPNGNQGALSDLADLYIMDYHPSLYRIAARKVINMYTDEELKGVLPLHITRDIGFMTAHNDLAPLQSRHDVAG